ncbi:2-ketoisovalerate ferredoxin oxidoreductase subunit alpha [Sulfurifustis variabilis]|uniref:2-ketoisovalerate ferredoxin oxidoreductase subunit alpha n=1 Tax=Sulfurifustis variabilis TaxID=1675686 RepID=A0A1B4VBK5_9GAMM|nr:pyruvate ferredoxin oxidoreductase [Sulfurifustis variabilis]BAU49774.1 2-ketoisovalerate ferredoxin oxidoreductase subunit alpha [Sulfurifustis variabilis]
MRRQLEGSRAVAEAVRLCRPRVIAAYPITPQTHIVEHLSQMVADGELAAEYISTESEFAAASVVLGAVAAGARAYTASASQGLLLMTEVLFNIAGLRLPVVMTCANRAVGAPINIYNDQQDSLSLRDAGWIQLYVESNQEALDTTIQAYRIAEACELPVMVCMDGFFLTHTFEAVEVPEQGQVDAYLPPFQFTRSLDPATPATLGGGSEPDNYLEYRRAHHAALARAAGEIVAAAADFERAFGRTHGALLDGYRLDDAERVLVMLGSAMGAARDVVDALRARGERVGALRLRCVRPFPAAELVHLLRAVRRVAVLEKALSAGAGGIIAAELRAALHEAGLLLPVDGFVGGLGGRDLTPAAIEAVYAASAAASAPIGCRFVDAADTSEREPALAEGG